jgi:hypothetical protein
MSADTRALLDIIEKLSPEGKRAIREDALRRLAREEMDREDIADARAALAEPGENLSLDQLKKELGL